MEYSKEDIDQLILEDMLDRQEEKGMGFNKNTLKVCNAKLKLKYTITGNAFAIKSYVYFLNDKLYLNLFINNWKDMSEKINLHKRICLCQTYEELTELLEVYQIDYPEPLDYL